MPLSRYFCPQAQPLRSGLPSANQATRAHALAAASAASLNTGLLSKKMSSFCRAVRERIRRVDCDAQHRARHVVLLARQRCRSRPGDWPPAGRTAARRPSPRRRWRSTVPPSFTNCCDLLERPRRHLALRRANSSGIGCGVNPRARRPGRTRAAVARQPHGAAAAPAPAPRPARRGRPPPPPAQPGAVEDEHVVLRAQSAGVEHRAGRRPRTGTRSSRGPAASSPTACRAAVRVEQPMRSFAQLRGRSRRRGRGRLEARRRARSPPSADRARRRLGGDVERAVARAARSRATTPLRWPPAAG